LIGSGTGDTGSGDKQDNAQCQNCDEAYPPLPNKRSIHEELPHCSYTCIWSCLSSVAWSCLSSLAHHVRLTTSLLLRPAPCLPAHHGSCRRSSWVGCSHQWHYVSGAKIGAQQRQREGLPGRACVSPVATTAIPIRRITLHYTCAQALSRVSRWALSPCLAAEPCADCRGRPTPPAV
jgi:hypothetical protein